MQMIILLLLISFVIWLMTLGLAEGLGNFFINHVINPIKDLLK